MPDPTIRPRVAELVFTLFDRPVHPELVETLAVRRVVRPGFTLTVRLTPTGHVVQLVTAGGTLTEVLAAAGQPLPTAGRRLMRPVGPGRRGKVVAAGVDYEMTLHAEALAPEVFAAAHAELIDDGSRRGLLVHFPPPTRRGPAPVGFVTADPVPRPAGFGLAVAAFHSFPAEFTVVKTVSLWEVPNGKSGIPHANL